MKKVIINFATKKDIKGLEKRMDFFHKDMTEAFKTVLERMGDLIERIDASNKRIDATLERLDKHDRKFEEQGKRQDAILEELRSNRIVLGSHEQRLQNVEFKVFPQ